MFWALWFLSTPGMTRRRLGTTYFLFMCSTPLHRLLWLHHVVRSLVGRWSSELFATFSIKVRCRVAICISMLGILKNFFLTVSFVMYWYFTSSILMPYMRQVLWCRNNSSFFRRDVHSAQLSHPHSNLLMGMTKNMRYSLRLLTPTSVHNLAMSPLYEFSSARCVLMS